jgi:hypothetical protein
MPWHVRAQKVNLLLIPRFRVRFPARAPTCCVSERQDVSLVYLTCQLEAGRLRLVVR